MANRTEEMTNYAERMGEYNENGQSWMDQATRDLRERGLEERRLAILGLTGFFETSGGTGVNETIFEVDELERQLAVIALGMISGSKFQFNDGRVATNEIRKLIDILTDMYEIDLKSYLSVWELAVLANLAD